MEGLKVTYLHGWSQTDDPETPLKGWRDDVVAHLSDGTSYRFSFYDPVRLLQDIESEGKIVERNLVVVKEVSRSIIEGLLHELHRKALLTELYKPE